jgi:glycosyltransferase involved in cell wall biosynthesis
VRICIVNEFFWPDTTGGTGEVLSDMARILATAHPDVHIDVIASRNLYRTPPAKTPANAPVSRITAAEAAAATKLLPRAETWNNIDIRRLQTPRPNGLRPALRLLANLAFSYAALVSLLKSPGYDVVLVGTAPPMVALAATAYKRMTGTPFVYTVYDLEPDRAVAVKLLPARHVAVARLRAAQHGWFREAAKVVVLGRCMRDYLQSHYGISKDKIAVIPVGADQAQIQPKSKNTAFRAEHNLNGFVVLYSGNFGRYHDFDTILDAAKMLGKMRLDVQFVLVGDGWQLDRVLDRIATEGIENVLVRPFVVKEDYADLLASADVSLITLEPGMDGLCVPSKFYSILASGRPSIAVVPPSTEVGLTIAEEDCGIRIDYGNAGALVDAVLSLVNDPARAERMGMNARNALVRKYSTLDTANAFYRAIVEAVGGQPVNAPGAIDELHKTAESLDEAEALPNT